MGEIGVPSLAAQVDFLVRRKFGKAVQDARMWGRVPLGNKEAEKYQIELYAMRPEEVQALYEQEHEKFRMELQAKADREEAQRFFNQPGAKADFEYWSKCTYWTLDEAVALSFGKAPEVVNWEIVNKYVGRSLFADQYARVRDLALRATRAQQLYDPVLPGFFLAWAKRNEIEYPAELENQVVARGHQIADWKTLYDGIQAQFNEIKKVHDAYVAEAQARLDDDKRRFDGLAAERDSLRVELERAKEKPLLTRERETVLKLIITMAIKGYGYDPTAKRGNEIGAIVGDLDSVGISLDADTVRKWLKEAAGLLSREGLDSQDR